MNFIFRCNASPKIGLGHLNRCRSLAYALKKEKIVLWLVPVKCILTIKILRF